MLVVSILTSRLLGSCKAQQELLQQPTIAERVLLPKFMITQSKLQFNVT